MSNKHGPIKASPPLDIKPCPFCGRSVAKLVEDAARMGHYVECENPCYARGPLHQGRTAIELWNEGVPKPPRVNK